MSKRKLGHIMPKKKRRSEILEAYSFEYVCDTLNGYLSGEITICPHPKRTAHSNNNRNKPNTS